VKLMHALAIFPGEDATASRARREYLERDVAGERGDTGRHVSD